MISFSKFGRFLRTLYAPISYFLVQNEEKLLQALSQRSQRRNGRKKKTLSLAPIKNMYRSGAPGKKLPSPRKISVTPRKVYRDRATSPIPMLSARAIRMIDKGTQFSEPLVKKKSEDKKVKTGRISKTWSQAMRGKPTGFTNTANNCFQNAMLQCILNNSDIYEFLRGIHLECKEGPRHCVVCALQDFCQDYWNPAGFTKRGEMTDRTMSISRLRRTVLANIPKYNDDLEGWHRGRQDDPMIFLRFLLGKIDIVAKKELSKVVDCVFERTWTCRSCHKVHRTNPPPETGVVLDIKSPARGLDLKTYLESVFAHGLPLQCDSATCKIRRDLNFPGHGEIEQTVFQRLEKTPEAFIIQLKRFEVPKGADGKHSLVNGRLEEVKISDPVHFDEFLNLGQYCVAKEEAMYQLAGVVFHKGRTTTSGHYVAAVRDPRENGYYYIDDERVVPTTFGKLEELASGQAYVLIYSKKES